MRQIHSAKVPEVVTGSASLRGTMPSAAAIRCVNTQFGRRVLIILPWRSCGKSVPVVKYKQADAVVTSLFTGPTGLFTRLR
ncbi:hypothetical protein DPMN_019507 [Dreissena polymorpha]|uniref:Uncharacterized protein n=1 Tax=Dreissena polymorpha TaxID=45954 RepID=A0A9D4NJD6_DREPO|nr:hypothetical protein DPMN_019507 [Dreissena polymorpha]